MNEKYVYDCDDDFGGESTVAGPIDLLEAMYYPTDEEVEQAQAEYNYEEAMKGV